MFANVKRLFMSTARAMLGLCGLEIHRKRAPQAADEKPTYYPTSASCQIPGLDFLYGFFLGRRSHGCFVEVGAYDGLTFSNSWGLAERGWSGLLVEPVPAFARRCKANHAGHPAVHTVNRAVGDGSLPTLTLRVAGPHSSADAASVEEYSTVSWARESVTNEAVTIQSTTLDELLQSENVSPDFDVLVVDVEGSEPLVFAGFTLARWRPKMLIVELVDLHPDLVASRVGHFQLGQALQEQGYTVCYKDSINTVFVRYDVLHAAYGEKAPSSLHLKS
jgi:FkbM family methyltransferase